MRVLDATTIRIEYEKLGMSDKQIAEKYGVHRTTICHFRKTHGIETRFTTHDIGHSYVRSKLEQLLYRFRDMKEKSKTSRFSFLVEQVVKVQVLTASLTSDETWKFSLTHKDGGEVTNGRFYKRLKSGRVRKEFSETCDVVILCCLYGEDYRLFIAPSRSLGQTLSVISIPIDGGRWNRLKDRWSVIDDMVRSKKGGYINV